MKLIFLRTKKVFLIIILFIILFTAIIPGTSYADENPKPPTVNGEAAILIDAKTGKVLFEKNSYQSMYPASITKIITGIIAIEQGNLEDIVTVSEDATRVEGTRVYLLPGEEVPLLKLVQGLMINSGNDAGVAIAEYMDGSVEKFAERMNEFVTQTVGVKMTHFTNPHGLFDPEHYTTARDMALITAYAMKNDTFREIVGTLELPWKGEGWETTIRNHNRLLGQYEGVTGVKNGYVSQSGSTLVTSAERGDTELIAVSMKTHTSQQIYDDMVTLFDYGFSQFETKTFVKADYSLAEKANHFIIPEEMTLTVKKEASVKVSIDNEGLLEVRDANSNELYHDQKLIEKKQYVDQRRLAISDDAENTNGAQLPFFQKVGIVLTWVVSGLYCLFLLLLAFFIWDKHIRMKQL